MKKFFKKFSQNEWRKIFKNALVCALVLSAVAVTYGYYLVDRMSSEYNQAQLLSLQDEEDQLIEPTDIDNEQPNNTSQEDKETVPTIAANDQPNDEKAQNEPTEEKIENEAVVSEQVESVKEPIEPVVSYEAVAAIASVNDSPCSIEETYTYGYGYDPIYNDIRFHNHTLYQADESFDVLAVADGVVEKCQTNEDGTEITIKHQWGLSVYAKVDECLVNEGESINKGQKIGETIELQYSLWQEK